MISFLKMLLPKPVKDFLSRKLNKRLNRRISKLPPVDWVGIPLEPLEVIKRTKRLPALIEVPLSKCRGLRAMAFPCGCDSIHPFIMALRYYDIKFLRSYYNIVQPGTVGELFDIDRKTSITAMPALSYVYPWDGNPSENIHQYRKMFVSNETRSHGGSKKFEGWHHFGPVSENKVQLEFQRLDAIYQSIKKCGYQRSDKPDGDIAGTVLKRENDYCIVISKGHHRLAALAAHGFTDIPLRVEVNSMNCVDRSSVSQWPGVKSSAFQPDEALQVFDRIFEGKQPLICNQWKDYCEKKVEKDIGN